MGRRIDINELPGALRFAFAPLIKRAMGFAVGAIFALFIFGASAVYLIRGAEAPLWLWLFENYFRGFDPESWFGALVGAFWAFWSGFVLGWFFAACRNFLVAAWLFTIRAKEQLRANRDFLDHI